MAEFAKGLGAQMPPGQFQFAAFLSYSRQDKALALWLVRALEELRLPREAAGELEARRSPFAAVRPVFRDESDMPVGGAIPVRLAEVLDASAAMIVLVTPASAQSAWVNEEIARFAERHPGRPIIPAVAEGDPDRSETYPPALLKLGKPLAADLRVREERWQAVVKIAAAVLELDVDRLVGRIARRRAARRMWITGGAAAAGAAFAALGYTAWQMSGEASRADDETRAHIGRLLNDTRRELDAVGLLAAKAAVHSAAKAYFDGKTEGQLNSKDLLLKAEWLRQEGVDASKRGEAEQALAYRKEAYATTEELLRRDPKNPEHLFSHAQSAFWLGDDYKQRGDLRQAKPAWETYRTAANRLFELASNYPGAMLEVHYANVNLGMLALEEERDPRAAAAAFIAALDVLKSSGDELDAKLNLSRSRLQYVEALAQYAPASEVLLAVEEWTPLLLDLEKSRSASDDVAFHLANAWEKVLQIEGDAGVAPDPEAQWRLIRGPDRDPDNAASMTFSAEMRLKAQGRPDCEILSSPSEIDPSKSADVRLTKECLPSMPRREQVARCSAFAGALSAQPDRLELEKVWSLLLAACSRIAVGMGNAGLSETLEDIASRRFFGGSHERLRLSTQISLAGFQTAKGNAWIQNLNASLDGRGWRNRGDH